MGMEFRPYYFAKEWKNKGHDVTILASSFSHSRVIQPKIKKLINYEEIDGINYIWIYGNNYKKNGILRVINILIFNIISLYLPFLLKKNFDVILIFFPLKSLIKLPIISSDLPYPLDVSI